MTLILASPHVREFEFRNLGTFCSWDPESWALESGILLNESGIPRKIGIQNPILTFKDWNQVSGIQNPRCEM